MTEAIEQPYVKEGFKKVQIGPKTQYIPENWGVIRLNNDEYVRRTMGGTPDTSVDEYWDGEIPWMRSGDIHQQYITDVEGRITKEGKSASRAEIIPEHSVLIGLNGQGKTKGTVAVNEIPLTTNQSVGAYIVNDEKLDYRYLYFSLDAKYSRLRALAGGGRSGLNLNLLGQVKIPYPPLPEQHRIADILSTVDQQIQQTDEIIEKTKELLSGVQQDLFTEGYFEHSEISTRKLIEAPLDWDIRPLSEFTVDSAYGPRFSSDEYAEDGDLATLRTTDLNDDGSINYETMPLADLSPSDFEDHLLEKNDFIISRTGAYCGICTVWDGYATPTVPGAYMIRFRLTDGLDPRFLRDYLNSSIGSERVNVLARGSSQKNLAGSDLLSMFIPDPNKEEQSRIVEVIQTVKNRIQDERETKQKLQELKRGLMQDLLTGKVRVNTSNNARRVRRI